MMTVGDARKRIHAIKQYTALGSGFKIAMRDLEIRGAGNLLHIARIKALAAAENIASVEISGQRLMLHRNGDYILLEGRRFPRLMAASPGGKLSETIKMLRTV